MSKARHDPVTIIMLNYPQNSHLGFLLGIGPKYATITGYGPDGDGGMREGAEWKEKRAKNIIIAGHHPDLVSKIRKAYEDYRSSVEKRDRDRETARYELMDKWDKEHPYVNYPNIKELVGNSPLLPIVER